MSERSNMTSYAGALTEQRVNVVRTDASARFSLRIAPAFAAAVGQAAGFDLSGEINSVIVSGTRIAARLGPDEWLLIALNDQAEPLTEGIETALAGHFHSLVEVTDRNVAIEVAGHEAPTVLSAGIPIDLDVAAFPAGSATRTLLGKAEVVLIRAGTERSYRVECWRSFGPYVYEYLDEAAREFSSR